ncbi:hypothetical protein [Aromatoleum buckelii]|uniref:Uncharacterized protein n=1 Tax=Aromatoleum buckelii TaxID=200254 RepID=A0ABX1N1M6_9RHOO|nr:hypothetical protein [Aromatoleum buckelii]MCK0509894.1 hypothetical protein [Aromatoleum buckelii]
MFAIGSEVGSEDCELGVVRRHKPLLRFVDDIYTFPADIALLIRKGLLKKAKLARAQKVL